MIYLYLSLDHRAAVPNNYHPMAERAMMQEGRATPDQTLSTAPHVFQMSTSAVPPRRTLVERGAEAMPIPTGAGNEMLDTVLTHEQLLATYFYARCLLDEAEQRAKAGRVPRPHDDITEVQAEFQSAAVSLQVQGVGGTLIDSLNRRPMSTGETLQEQPNKLPEGGVDTRVYLLTEKGLKDLVREVGKGARKECKKGKQSSTIPLPTASCDPPTVQEDWPPPYEWGNGGQRARTEAMLSRGNPTLQQGAQYHTACPMEEANVAVACLGVGVYCLTCRIPSYAGDTPQDNRANFGSSDNPR
ncbi:uncharacterized protein LOC124470375 [Hypomesus transpacificus]|uniref:uncharacterized protein LOC124470375 n=1 Tax=Hypomesus transpacificus TaxID=137520 RepID=UPI001F077556|nr:uncharacterized protein LOC124470375 [Hypomesus transpacificus]